MPSRHTDKLGILSVPFKSFERFADLVFFKILGFVELRRGLKGLGPFSSQEFFVCFQRPAPASR